MTVLGRLSARPNLVCMYGCSQPQHHPPLTCRVCVGDPLPHPEPWVEGGHEGQVWALSKGGPQVGVVEHRVR
jgi:hypothetical protein